MTFTYASTDLTTELAQIRLMIGDTVSSDPLLTDEEITYFTDTEGSQLGAAARCCDAIGAKFSRQADKTEGKLSISLSQKSKQYYDLARMLRQELITGSAKPTSGGISISDKYSRDTESDRVMPAFTVGMMDYDSEYTDTSS